MNSEYHDYNGRAKTPSRSKQHIKLNVMIRRQLIRRSIESVKAKPTTQATVQAMLKPNQILSLKQAISKIRPMSARFSEFQQGSKSGETVWS